MVLRHHVKVFSAGKSKEEWGKELSIVGDFGYIDANNRYMEKLLSVEFLGVLALTIIVSALVALVAIRKKIGYWWAFVVCFALSMILVMARLPFPLWIASSVCLVAFAAWPKRDLAAEAKNR